MKADVAIVIVTYNSEGHIAPCLESVFAQRKSVSQQVIVVDNSPNDRTVDFIRTNFPEVELVVPGANLGFAKGVNLGVRHSDAEFVLLLNPDTILLENAVDVIVDFARKNPGHGLYGGRTQTPEGELDPSSCWGLPSLWSLGMFACGLTTFASGNPWLDPESLGKWKRDTVREVGVITGCFLLATTEVWTELGGLDERYFMYGEDADLGMRARRAGYRPVICPDAKLIHEDGGCSETPAHKMLLLFKGKASLVRMHWSGPARSLGLLFLASGTGLRAVLSKFKSSSAGNDTAGRWQTVWRERKDWLQGYGGQAG